MTNHYAIASGEPLCQTQGAVSTSCVPELVTCRECREQLESGSISFEGSSATLWLLVMANKYKKSGRNTKCPCLNGKKFKHCHIDTWQEELIRASQSVEDAIKYVQETVAVGYGSSDIGIPIPADDPEIFREIFALQSEKQETVRSLRRRDPNPSR